MRIGILTGGGDVPGLNPCIKAIVEGAAERGWAVTGFLRGWQGVMSIDPDLLDMTAGNGSIELTPARVRGIDRRGGTILHTSRTDPRRQPEGDRTDHVRAVLKAMGIDVMVTLGGDGTLRFSAHLSSLGMPVISIPKTMDNDVYGTDYCIGFSTAVSRSVAAINALRTTTASHERIAIVELFGRRSGETALLSGFLAQADRIAIAEVPVDEDRLIAQLVADREANPENYSVLVISEGARLASETEGEDQLSRSNTQRNPIGVGQRLARQIEEKSGVGTVVQELAYLMRAGAPDALDRMVGFAFGTLAVQLIERGETGRLVALRDGNYEHVPIGTVLEQVKKLDVSRLYDPQTHRAKIASVEGMPMFLY
ncbi:6-phosphofructokinase [Pedomonas sp. V897]|uniref:6-phosphofructokinase n=1 Tax=Pedomonas sp. V897 TaxID=3446482 RepID=UPI003EE2FE27